MLGYECTNLPIFPFLTPSVTFYSPFPFVATSTKFFFLLNFMSVSVLSACMSVHHMHAVHKEARAGCHIPQGLELQMSPCGCWEANLAF